MDDNVIDVCYTTYQYVVIMTCVKHFGQHSIKHNVESCEHIAEKLQEIQNSIMRESVSILSSALVRALYYCLNGRT